jgi:hypothetical protein
VAFTFKITHVDQLPASGVGVLDGTLVEGKVKTGLTVKLVHEGRQIPLKIKGVVLSSGGSASIDNNMSLSFDLKQPAMRVARAGDLLVA